MTTDMLNTSPNDRETLRWIVARFRSILIPTICASLAEVVASANGVAFAFCTRNVIDSAVARDYGALIFAAIQTGALILWTIAVDMGIDALAERIRAGAQVALQNRIYGALLKKDFETSLARSSGDVMNRLTSDVAVVCNGVSTIIPSFVSLTTRLVFAFAALCYFDVRFATVFLCVGVSVFFGTRLFRKRLKRLHREVQEAEGRKRAFWQETLDNLFVVKTFARESLAVDRSLALQNEHYRATMRRRNFSLVAGGGFRTVFSASYFFALVWTAFKLCAGVVSFGTMTATLQLVGRVQTPFSGLSGLLPRYFNALASAERLRELEDIPDERGADEPTFDAAELFDRTDAIVFDDVSFAYRREEGGEVQVLDRVSLELPVRRNVVFRGRSGLGKSTFFKLLTGVLRPTSGEIYLRTRSGRIPLDRRARSLFATVPQGNLLFSGAIRENVAFFRSDVSEERIRTALRASCATDFVDAIADGIDATLGEKGVGLSEGQAQRIAIARAVATDAPILLLDEATSALDAASERNVLTRLAKESGKTLYLVSHRPAAFDFADVFVEPDEEGNVTIRDAKADARGNGDYA